MIPPHASNPAVGRQVLFLISSMILCIVVPIWLYTTTGGDFNARSPWWALAVLVLSGFAYAAVIASRHRQLFAMVLWLFTYIFMGMAPYVQYRLDVLPSTTPAVDPTKLPSAGLLVLLCCATAIIGGLIARRTTKPVRHLQAITVSTRRTNILTAVGILLFLYYANSVGLGAFLLNRTELSRLRSLVWPDPAVSALLTGALHMILLVVFVAHMVVRRQTRAAGHTPQILPALLAGALLLYVVNPVNSPRYVVGTVILGMLAALGAYATPARFRIMAGASMAGMVFLFPLADAFRRTTDPTIKVQGPLESMTTGDFDAFAQIANALSFIESQGLTWGQQILGALLFWVPRALWPGKPTGTGNLLAEFQGYDFTNLSAPIWAELAIDFGWVGAALGLGLLGYWFRLLDVRTDLYLRTTPMPPVVVCTVAFYLLIVLRGSLINAASYLLVILLASWFVTKHQPRLRERLVLREHPPVTGVGGAPAVREPDDRLVR